MAVSQADIDALNSAIASAERQVTNGNQSVTLRSIADLVAARNDLLAQMAAQTGVRRRKQFTVFQAGRGYNE